MAFTITRITTLGFMKCSTLRADTPESGLAARKPAGAGHERLSGSKDLLVIGAYTEHLFLPADEVANSRYQVIGAGVRHVYGPFGAQRLVFLAVQSIVSRGPYTVPALLALIVSFIFYICFPNTPLATFPSLCGVAVETPQSATPPSMIRPRPSTTTSAQRRRRTDRSLRTLHGRSGVEVRGMLDERLRDCKDTPACLESKRRL
jgi:hypothetical protein